MRMRIIRILDLPWKKMDPDPGHFFKIYWIFLTKKNFQIFIYIFRIFLSHNFMNHEIIQKAKILRIQIRILSTAW